MIYIPIIARVGAWLKRRALHGVGKAEEEAAKPTVELADAGATIIVMGMEHRRWVRLTEAERAAAQVLATLSIHIRTFSDLV